MAYVQTRTKNKCDFDTFFSDSKKNYALKQSEL